MRTVGLRLLQGLLFMVPAGFSFYVIVIALLFLSLLRSPCDSIPDVVFYAFICLTPCLVAAIPAALLTRFRRRLLSPLFWGLAFGPLLVFIIFSLPTDPSKRVYPPNREPNQISLTGAYVLSAPIERDPKGICNWHITIKDRKDLVLYKDTSNDYSPRHSVYWIWDDQDRAWVYNSDNGFVYVYDAVGGIWDRNRWDEGTSPLTPPDALWPEYHKKYMKDTDPDSASPPSDGELTQ